MVLNLNKFIIENVICSMFFYLLECVLLYIRTPPYPHPGTWMMYSAYFYYEKKIFFYTRSLYILLVCTIVFCLKKFNFHTRNQYSSKV